MVLFPHPIAEGDDAADYEQADNYFHPPSPLANRLTLNSVVFRT